MYAQYISSRLCHFSQYSKDITYSVTCNLYVKRHTMYRMFLISIILVTVFEDKSMTNQSENNSDDNQSKRPVTSTKKTRMTKKTLRKTKKYNYIQ